ncbi:integrin alpha [Nitrosomonas ureae]|uniref:FG-GAP repeat-containing protein n=1 Tax=Nitrosomonas ureae TaxID=44577 RepID=A0A286AKY3_9PROT|nr:integrin alpha [Nitrosomonas ureae]SOD22535.1 FG-GAP repeat-containing protein [Nitrosomonas ureae]
MAGPIFNLSELNGKNGFRLDGIAEDDASGRSVSNAGDVNGDGFDDVIVGAYSADPNGSKSGSSYVVFGKASGVDSAMNLSSLDGNNGFRLDGGASYDFSGESVSNAGDINGDGFDDVIIGAHGADLNGSSYVVFGKATGFEAAINLSSLDGKNGFRLDGRAYEYSSHAVSGAGDVNGDGFDDLIIGASRGVYQPYNSYVVFGKASEFNPAMNLSNLDGENGFQLLGGGSSVSSAGDINGDGFDDVIIGDPNSQYQWSGYEGEWYTGGASYVIFGKASVFDSTLNVSTLDGENGFSITGGGNDFIGASISTAGDINGDGFDDLIIGSDGRASNYVVFGKASAFSANLSANDFDGNHGFSIKGEAIRVSDAGDVNGDGYDDLIVGSGFASYVIFGKASYFESIVDLSTLNGRNGFNLKGVELDDHSGSSVSGAGDVNGDGYADLIIGASGSDPNGDQSGSSYVVFGGNFFSTDIYIGTSEDDVLTGSKIAERFEGSDGNDRMNGLGGADVFHGDAGDDTIAVSDLDFQLVDGGIGNDTLELAGSGLNLNLVNFHDLISGIETIDLTGIKDDLGNDSNTLTLALSDLLSLSGTSDTFTVNGNSGDRVVGLVDGWADGGFNHNYHIYTNQGMVLRSSVSV